MRICKDNRKILILIEQRKEDLSQRKSKAEKVYLKEKAKRKDKAIKLKEYKIRSWILIRLLEENKG